MNKYNVYLHDRLGNEIERKNLYLRELAELQAKLERTSGEEKRQVNNAIKSLKNNKKDHPYMIEYEKFKSEEKIFLKALNNEKKNYKALLLEKNSKKVTSLKVKYFEAEKKSEFYNGFANLDYDAQLIEAQSKLRLQQIPEIIQYLEKTEIELKEAKEHYNNIDQNKLQQAKKEYEIYKKEQKEIYEATINKINKKFKDKIISESAKDNSIKKAKRTLKKNLSIKSFESEDVYYKELIKNKRYELKKGYKQKLNVLNVNESDVRKTTPSEPLKASPKQSYFSWIIPGIGQLLNKQFVKGLIFFIGAVFIYGVAIPYALGYGNYRGDGLAGLFNLAQGGGRLDKSLIFMIEGIMALFLLIFSFFIFFAAFKDSKKVEKNCIYGIRANTWFETKEGISEDGFPYLVTAPAAIVIIFIVLIPILTTILLSFTNMDPNHQNKFNWIGLQNYGALVLGQGLAGSIFWRILLWTIIWTLLATTLGILIGFGLALLLNSERVKGKVAFRSIFLLPWAVPAFITITFFSIMMSNKGSITSLLEWMTGTNIDIKNNVFLARTALIMIQGWLGSAYIFLLSTGVLQSINKDLYEAGEIDGASNFQKLMKITVPLVLFQTAPLLIGQYTFNFNNFTIIYLFNGGGPFNPAEYGNLAGSTDILISYIYKLTMENDYQAIGAAITVLVSAGLMFVAYLGFRRTAAFKREDA